jgi:hypothetical protein
MRIYQSPLWVLGEKPDFADDTGVPGRGTFLHLRSSQGADTSSHHGLVDAISSDQTFTVANAAELLRSIGGTMGALGETAGQIESSFFSKGFAATWTIFQDMRIVRFRSCCAISASGCRHTPLSWSALLQLLPAR